MKETVECRIDLPRTEHMAAKAAAAMAGMTLKQWMLEVIRREVGREVKTPGK